MSKIYFKKILVLFAFFLFLANFAKSQNNFEFRGKLIVDRIQSKNAVINVYYKSNLVINSKTDKYGSFILSLENNKKYTLEFKVENVKPLKVMVQTNFKNNKDKFIKTKRQIFNLSSNALTLKNSDVITAYRIEDSGMSETKDLAYEPESFNHNEKVEEFKNNINNDKLIIKDTIKNLPIEEQTNLNKKFSFINKKIDSLLVSTEKQSKIILKSAEKEAKKIIKKAYYNLPKEIEKETRIDENKSLPDKEIIKKLEVNEKEFYEREDIKKHKVEIEKLKSIKNKSAKESVEYMSSMVIVQEELIKTAKMQLEIDKLNAKTKEDSIALQQREVMIYLAEKEINAAKNKIAFQELEIKQKNTFLFFVITALIFFIILSALVYNSFRHKKKTNVILGNQNIDIANKNKKIIDSIRYAQTIQQAILPIKESIDKHFESFIIFQPKDIVSGDFYWFNYYSEVNKSVVAIVDCTGHGVPGAFMSMIANRLLVEIISEKRIFDTVQILEQLDEKLHQALMQDETSNNDGMDLVICVIEKKDNNAIIEYAGAKRPLFYTQNNLDNLLHIKGTVRGIGGRKRLRKKKKKEFQKHIINLNKGEILYLTTDGFFDLQSPNRKKFGRVNFMKLIENNLNKSLKEQKEIIVDTLYKHKGSETQIDDITVMGIKI